MKKVNINYIISDFVCQFKLGLIRRLRFVKLAKINFILRLVNFLYKQGVIRLFIIKKDYILMYYKYYKGRSICSNISVISKPSNKVYWNLNKLSRKYNRSFLGFYIISTNKGLVSSEYCLLEGRISGEILIKVEL